MLILFNTVKWFQLLLFNVTISFYNPSRLYPYKYPPTAMSVLYMTLNCLAGETPVLELEEMWSTPSLPLLPDVFHNNAWNNLTVCKQMINSKKTIIHVR